MSMVNGAAARNFGTVVLRCHATFATKIDRIGYGGQPVSMRGKRKSFVAGVPSAANQRVRTSAALILRRVESLLRH